MILPFPYHTIRVEDEKEEGKDDDDTALTCFSRRHKAQEASKQANEHKP